jgi:hypothetical protein
MGKENFTSNFHLYCKRNPEKTPHNDGDTAWRIFDLELHKIEQQVIAYRGSRKHRIPFFNLIITVLADSIPLTP